MPDRAPWLVFWGGRRYGRKSTRQAAMNLVDRGMDRVGGHCTVRHERNGETWERRAGSWHLTAPAAPREGRK